jgi:hypothetical protein
MRKAIWSWVAAFGAVAGTASAQQQSGGPSMPGQIVSKGFNLKPAGMRLPAAAPQAGTHISSPLTKPYDPNRPLDVFKGTNIDPKSVVAPVSGVPGTQQPDLLDRINSKLGSVTSFFRPSSPVQARPMITPGIFRRNRERTMQRNWRAD